MFSLSRARSIESKAPESHRIQLDQRRRQHIHDRTFATHLPFCSALISPAPHRTYTMEFEGLTEQQHKEYSFQFLLFDKDGDDHIASSELGTLIRSLGKYPTNSEIENMIELVDGDHSGLIAKEDFLRLMATQGKRTETEEDVRDAFRVFDKSTDSFISAAELRHILTNLGERMPEALADEILKDADIDGDGQINYDELIRKLMTDYQ